MYLTELITVLGAVTALIVACTAAVNAFRGLEVHINSRLDQLLDITRTAAIAEGRKLERDITNEPGPSAG